MGLGYGTNGTDETDLIRDSWCVSSLVFTAAGHCHKSWSPAAPLISRGSLAAAHPDSCPKVALEKSPNWRTLSVTGLSWKGASPKGPQTRFPRAQK